jgi:uncharacterized membrane protein YfcA
VAYFAAIAVVGFIAQLVDGSLGMGYGVTSTSLLLTLGLTPAIASASVHLAEIGTSGVSGFSHWRLGNVNWRVLVLLAIPGGVGAFLGAVVLSNLAIDAARPLVSLILLVLGGTILFRFWHERRVAAQIEEATRRADGGTNDAQPGGRRARPWMLVPLGLVGGFLDASGGGGWGPVTTSTMMAASRMRPRTIIGTVSGSEFIVAIAASTGFLLALGTAGIDPMLVAMLLLGGAIAAPLAAYLVTRFSDRSLGTAVGGVIIFLNLDRAAVLFGLDPTVAFALRLIVAAVTVLVVAGLIVRGVSRRRSAAGSAA